MTAAAIADNDPARIARETVRLERELKAAPDAPWADAMCAGVSRYLNTPLKRHHGLRIASQALDFIAKET